jgi:D-amino-acid dehydrogenase
MRTVVIGAGIVGSSLAYHLAIRGAEVTIFDPGTDGWATGAGAGIISGETTGHPRPEYFQVALQAGRYYSQLVDALGGDAVSGYDRCTLLEVAMADDDAEAFNRRRNMILDRNRDNAQQVAEISPHEAYRLCPHLGPIKTALVHWNASRVDGRRLTQALLNASQQHGAVLKKHRVQSLTTAQSRITGVQTDEGVHRCDVVFLAAGAWCHQLINPLGIKIPVQPQRGQIVHVMSEGAAAGSWPAIVGAQGHYLLPWPDGRVIAGATRETGSGSAPIFTVQGQEEVLRQAMRVVPALSTATILEWRVGIRPLSADQMPILGEIPGWEGLQIATGHGAGGLLMGPYSAKLVADAVLDGRQSSSLQPFSIARFG